MPTEDCLWPEMAIKTLFGAFVGFWPSAGEGIPRIRTLKRAILPSPSWSFVVGIPRIRTLYALGLTLYPLMYKRKLFGLSLGRRPKLKPDDISFVCTSRGNALKRCENTDFAVKRCSWRRDPAPVCHATPILVSS